MFVETVSVSVYRRYSVSQEALISTNLFVTLPASCPQSTLIVFTVKFCVNYLEVCYQKISPVCLFGVLPGSYTTRIGRIRVQQQQVETL